MIRARLFPALLALLLFPPLAQAQSVILEWDAVTLDVSGQPETLRGYEIGYGIQPPGDYTDGFSVGAGDLSAQVDNLQGGATYVFSVRAVDLANNESAWATEVSYEVPSEICSNLIDDDADGLTDCFDSDCPPDTEDGTSLCDGFDNDCDDEIDENLDAPACAMQDGVCAGATQPCAGSSGFVACGAADYGADYEASEASCDGQDNDCDGSTDNGLTAPACALQLGVCTGSVQACQGAPGWGACDYGADYEAESETRCDDLDNDCDGSVDEGLAGCCTEGDTVACSTDEGECSAGQQVCDAAGNWSECSGVLPVTEECNGLDDDCDGATDDNLTPPACGLTAGVCAGAQPSCQGSGGWSACDYGADHEPTESSCDGLDNDCDGQTDEALQAPACALSLGVCADSRQSCGGAAGWQACSPATYGSDYEMDESLCDGLDNDCDGQTDEAPGCDPQTDGGGSADGGEEIVISGGCGCDQASRPGALPPLLLLGLLLALRRRA